MLAGGQILTRGRQNIRQLDARIFNRLFSEFLDRRKQNSGHLDGNFWTGGQQNIRQEVWQNMEEKNGKILARRTAAYWTGGQLHIGQEDRKMGDRGKTEYWT